MDSATLQQALVGLPLGGLRYFDRVGSTNDEADRWARTGAPDLALVVADEQTSGRGRAGRRWFNPPGAALAFSLVLRELPGTRDEARHAPPEVVTRLTALGALATALALRETYGLPALIKWPNDVLLERCKLAGVLVEASWQGEELEAAILGVGVNVTPQAVPPDVLTSFPATCVQAGLGRPLSRQELLCAILSRLLEWRSRLAEIAFLQAWEALLAFRSEWVEVSIGQGSQDARQAQILGLDPQGRLRLRDRQGAIFSLHTGEVRLRPLNIDQET
ncbi:MAG: biotin--[acetyl-CoA-carboxylase] ligase [Anaerolineales bacterium]|nr:biotin--[acetyl-CoA-carboxylase] ligase [Anaerolineales bacterium]